MQAISTLISGIAVILATGQAFLTWNSRNDHIEAIIAAQRMQACAELGTAAGAFASGAQQFLSFMAYNQAEFDAFRGRGNAVGERARAAGYVLPADTEDDLDRLSALPRDIVDAAFARGGRPDPSDTSSPAFTLLAEFEAVSERIQTTCRDSILLR